MLFSKDPKRKFFKHEFDICPSACVEGHFNFITSFKYDRCMTTEHREHLFSQKAGEAPSQSHLELTAAEQEQLEKRLASIVRVVSDRMHMHVTTHVDPVIKMRMALQGQDAEQEWYHSTQRDRKTGEIIDEHVHIPAKLLEATENVAKGKAAHEGGHAAITRLHFIPDDVMQQTGFHAMMMAAEERPTDQVVRNRFRGAGKWVDEARRASIQEEPMGIESRIPKFSQLCNLIVYEPHYPKMPAYYDTDVLRTYGEIRTSIERVENMVPPKGTAEEEVVQHAKDRYTELYFDVWPKVQKLVGEDEKKFTPQELKDIEDMIVNALAGKLVESLPETHKEFDDRIAGGARKREIDEEMEEITKRLAEMEERKGKYEKIYQQVREYDEQLYRRLEDIFTPNVKTKMSLRRSGQRVNLRALYKWDAARKMGSRQVDDRIFESITIPKKRDYSFMILVDLSSSMAFGNRIQETHKAVVALTETLNRLGVPYAIYGFQDELIRFKKVDEELTNEVRDKIGGMEGEVYGSNPGGHNESGYNDDGPCLEEASKDLSDFGGEEQILIVLSDGEPCGRRSTEQDLHRAVAHISHTTEQRLIAVGLGNRTEFVKNYYPASLPNVTMDKLSDVLGGLMEDVILHPEKYKTVPRSVEVREESEFEADEGDEMK